MALVAALAAGTACAQFPPQIRYVIVVVQENRTPDNLFHFLKPACPIPRNATGLKACAPSPVTSSCYNIAPCGLSNRAGHPVPVTLQPRPLADSVDPMHSHAAFLNMCDPAPGSLACQNDGAWKTAFPLNASYAYVADPAVTNFDGSSGHLLDPYLTLATQYGWANYMFQTNQGPSYPAHQFIFGGTSAQTADGDANSTFISGNIDNQIESSSSGCLAPASSTNLVISPALSSPAPDCTLSADGSVQECPIANRALIYPTQPVGTFCYPHKTMADLLDAQHIGWKYYAPTAGSLSTAPDSIRSICAPAFVDPNNNPGAGLRCTGSGWTSNVDLRNLGTDILTDIANCTLAQVSWVVPDGQWSDHADENDLYGPSWVAAIVNAIGSYHVCPGAKHGERESYWHNSAIVITWDDWGGWSDHEPPPSTFKLPCRSTDCQGDFQYGFRVPMVVVSAYTPAGYINNQVNDFGSILRMIEGVNGIPEGALGFADKRATTDLHEFFTLPQARPYVIIPAQKDFNFFLSQHRAPMEPDND